MWMAASRTAAAKTQSTMFKNAILIITPGLCFVDKFIIFILSDLNTARFGSSLSGFGTGDVPDDPRRTKAPAGLPRQMPKLIIADRDYDSDPLRNLLGAASC